MLPYQATRDTDSSVTNLCICPAGDGARGASLQDILRLLTLWFSHGAAPDVAAALEEGFGHVSIDTWLVVIPQVHC